VLVRWRVTVVGLDNLVEEWGEGVVALVASGVDSDAGVGPLGTREDALLEGVTKSVSLVLALLPDITREGLGEEGLGSAWEVWEFGDLVSRRIMVGR